MQSRSNLTVGLAADVVGALGVVAIAARRVRVESSLLRAVVVVTTLLQL